MRLPLLLRTVTVAFIMGCCFVRSMAFGASATPALLKARQEAEAAGYTFFTNHDEIVSMAKKEGKLRVSSGLNTPNFNPLISAFKQKYPFVTDIRVEEIQGTDAYQRFILEIKSRQAKAWDITHIPLDFGKEYLPFLMRHDILGMANHSVLKIDPRMIHPVRRNVMGVLSTVTLVPYNKKLISEDKVPAKWEEFLKPEFKGKKFVVNISPTDVVPLVSAWGLEKRWISPGR